MATVVNDKSQFHNKSKTFFMDTKISPKEEDVNIEILPLESILNEKEILELREHLKNEPIISEEHIVSQFSIYFEQ